MQSKAMVRFRASVFFKAFGIISPRDRKITIFSTLVQLVTGVLDLAGVALIGALGALTISGLNAKEPGNRLNAALEFMGIDDLSYKYQIGVIGLAAVIILLGKTLFSAFFSKKTINFLSRLSSESSTKLLQSVLRSPYIEIRNINSKEISFAIRWGMRATLVGIVGAASTLLTDVSLTFILFVGLFLVDPIICLVSILIFTFVGISLYWSLNHKARFLGTQEARLSIAIDQEISELFGSLKELMVRQRAQFYYSKTSLTLREIAKYQSDQAFLPLLSKYVIEAAIVCATVLVIAIEFLTQDSSRAIATTTVFFAAASRIAPAVLRMQQSLVSIKGNIGVAESTIKLYEKFQSNHTQDLQESKFEDSHVGFNGTVELKEVDFYYPDSATPTISGINMKIKAGQFIGITGISGVGKTTLVNLILGLYTPTSGVISISGLKIEDALRKYPGSVAFVPQDVFITDGSVRDNIELGYQRSEIGDLNLERAINRASLSNFIDQHSEGLNFATGENGNKLSGGEKQRVGIARALITKPKILILDEATSALDGVTEAEITKTIENLAGETTVIVIAHRLSTVRNADNIFFLGEKSIVSEGTFSELRTNNQQFRVLCEHMGL